MSGMHALRPRRTWYSAHPGMAVSEVALVSKFRKRELWYGTVYLLHFTEPYHHARHYVGWTGHEQGRNPMDEVKDRLDFHLSGLGSPLVRAVHNRGIVVVVARVWENRTREYERGLHNRRPKSLFCPLCFGQTPCRQPALSLP